MAFIICRPVEVLKLPDAQIIRREFTLDAVEDNLSIFWYLKWQAALRRLRERRVREKVNREDVSDFHKSYTMLLRATQYALHPALVAQQTTIPMTEAGKLKERLAELYKENTKTAHRRREARHIYYIEVTVRGVLTDLKNSKDEPCI